MTKRTAIIIGAGPAGLTAALELLRHTDIHPIILEATDMVGGLSRTVKYHGNRMDIGGHRFFSKSDAVMDWWRDILPLQKTSESDDRGMLLRHRVSRIYFLRRFFDYPVSLTWKTFANLGLLRMMKIGVYYLAACANKRQEKSLEDFFINRFGKELYQTFFKDYTEKVWGISCKEIPADWGAQRIKGLSILRLLQNGWRKLWKGDAKDQKTVETSLIEQFWYPKFGPGQLWEETAKKIQEQGGELHFQSEVQRIDCSSKAVKSVWAQDAHGNCQEYRADFVFSTMPMRDLIAAMGSNVPQEVRRVANGLVYRDFITAGLLVDRLKLHSDEDNKLISDNWIYI